MTQRIQFYAYTPATEVYPNVTPYLQAFKEADNAITIVVRGKDGKEASITIDPKGAVQFSMHLGASKFAHEVIAARQERDAARAPEEGGGE